MATNASHEIISHSVFRPQGSDPLSTKPSVHLRNSQRTRTTVGLHPNKAPLPPGPTSVYSRGSFNHDLRVTGRAKSNSVPNGALSYRIRSNDLTLQTIEEDQSASLVKYSRHSIISDDGFDWLDDDTITVFKDDDNSKALEKCQNSILKPYYVILKLIGWKQLFQYDEIHDHCIKKVVNMIFAIVVVITLLIGFFFQEILCFRRDRAFNEEVNTANGSSFVYLRCDGAFVRVKAVANLLVLISYVFGYYIFRYSQREHLSNLTEKVFLGYTDKVGQFSQKKLIRYLKLLGCIGLVWFLLSIPLNILRVYSLQLLSRDTYYYYLTSHSEEELIDLYNQNMRPPSESEVRRYIYIVISVIGYITTDLFYIAAIINYALQCQLITFLINVTVERICRNCWKVDHAIKEIKVTQDFLKVLNGQVASQMSVLLFVLIQIFISATRNWLKTDGDNIVAIIAGLLNTVSWLFLALFIIVQAALVTITCQKIRYLGMDLRTRPYTYSQTSQLDLDSLVLYTTSITVDVSN